MPSRSAQTSLATKVKVDPSHPSAVGGGSGGRDPETAGLPSRRSNFRALFRCRLLERCSVSSPNFISLVWPSSSCCHFLLLSLVRAESVLPTSSPLFLLFPVCLPPHLCFSLLLLFFFFFLSVWRDDVKLKNGVSWWAGWGWGVTKLFHANISILLCL